MTHPTKKNILPASQQTHHITAAEFWEVRLSLRFLGRKYTLFNEQMQDRLTVYVH